MYAYEAHWESINDGKSKHTLDDTYRPRWTTVEATCSICVAVPKDYIIMYAKALYRCFIEPIDHLTFFLSSLYFTLTITMDYSKCVPSSGIWCYFKHAFIKISAIVFVCLSVSWRDTKSNGQAITTGTIFIRQVAFQFRRRGLYS